MKLKILFVSVIALLIVLTVCVGVSAQKSRVKVAKNGAQQQQRSVAELWFDSQVRADGKDSVWYIKGYAYSYIPGERPQKLFGVEGYNIRRAIPTPERDGYFIATREVVFYTDPMTNQILSEWSNPFTKQKNEVFHIANDPVNFRVRTSAPKRFVSVSMNGQREFGEAPPPEAWEDYYVWHSDVFPFYPLEGQTKNYTAAELFDFYVPKRDLTHRGAPSVMVSWTRTGQWLPWMKMDGNNMERGVIIYHARSKRFESWEQLPVHIKKEVREKYPLYLTAPDRVDPNRPNATSWTVYAEEMKRRAVKGRENPK